MIGSTSPHEWKTITPHSASIRRRYPVGRVVLAGRDLACPGCRTSFAAVQYYRLIGETVDQLDYCPGIDSDAFEGQFPDPRRVAGVE
ncbi:hypothetical protein HSR122_1800 [Halapricum desulfuricans]|uniref:Uncharacterized protein n=1 Tax=Halapricum desulfuricans TaxID=2841257 RepID=A0A897NFQ7_9EURY|nr:hypothetical protein HSR122_1800 [Halapricum desulfuricans]